MSEKKQILELYPKDKFGDKPDLSITSLEKLHDGWESDNYLLTVDHGNYRRIGEDWVWRICSGVGSQRKAAWDFKSMKKSSDAGYPVPRVFLMEADHSPVERPFMIRVLLNYRSVRSSKTRALC